jgi:predicted outer membrane protein
VTHIKTLPRSNHAAIQIGVFAAVIALGACTTNQPPSSPPPSSVAHAARPRYGATMMQPSVRGVQGGGRAATSAPSSTAPKPVSEAELATLDDAHLSGLIEEVNDGAARFASLGERRVTDHKVKRFAHDLVSRHVATQSKFRDRLVQLGIDPASGPLREQVRAEVGRDLEALPSARGEDFDRAYVDGQLRDLTRAADLLDRIIGHVQRPDLRAAVEDLRSRLDADIRGAESLRDSLHAGTTNRRPDAYDPDKFER